MGRISIKENKNIYQTTIQEELEKISITVETLQLWAEKMLANNVIDATEYKKRKKVLTIS